jgi:hypothetical protein
MKFQADGSKLAIAVIGAGSIAVLGAGAGVGLAATTQAGVIHGCVAKSDGALRIVKSSNDCSSHERPLSFNKQGPQGEPGADAQSGTFQMFANVDAEGDLGSNFDATSARLIGVGNYFVTFSQQIGHCAADAQVGDAGGPDQPDASLVTVAPDSADPTHEFLLEFLTGDGNHAVNTPFMLTLTCETSP